MGLAQAAAVDDDTSDGFESIGVTVGETWEDEEDGCCWSWSILLVAAAVDGVRSLDDGDVVSSVASDAFGVHRDFFIGGGVVSSEMCMEIYLMKS